MNLYTRIRNMIKTISVNRKVFEPEVAKKRPLYISYQTKCKGLYKGCIEIESDSIYPGMIQFGHKAVSLPARKSCLEFEEGGKLILKGKADFDKGIYLCVFRNAKLVIGNNLFVNTNSIIHCHKRIEIGNDNMWGWEILVKDSDGHPILDQENNLVNADRAITIGDNVWLGAYSKVLKGAAVPNGSIVGLGSIVTKEYNKEGSILSGVPARERKEGIKWDRGKIDN